MPKGSRTILGVPARKWLLSVVKHVLVYGVIVTIAMLSLLYLNR